MLLPKVLKSKDREAPQPGVSEVRRKCLHGVATDRAQGVLRVP